MFDPVGTYKIQCVEPGGHTLAAYNDYYLAENQVIDLLDTNLPSHIQASDWSTADIMCRDTAYEIAQQIAAGNIVVVEKKMPLLLPAGE